MTKAKQRTIERRAYVISRIVYNISDVADPSTMRETLTLTKRFISEVLRQLHKESLQ